MSEQTMNIATAILLLWDADRSRSPEDMCRPYHGLPEHAALLAEVRRRIQDLKAVDTSPDTPREVPGDPRVAAVPPGPAQTAALPPPTPGLRYRVVRPHARGGLGEVFVAEDEELHRDVALKRIREDRQGESSRRHFLREAEITAKLEHPGVVPVYGLVRGPDGIPPTRCASSRANHSKTPSASSTKPTRPSATRANAPWPCASC